MPSYLTDVLGFDLGSAAYGFMILSQFFYGACVAGLNCAYSDMSPNYSPIMNAIANSVSAVGGFVGPLVVAALTTAYPGIDGWRAAFYLTAAMAV
eukprot:gene44742-55674_t